MIGKNMISNNRIWWIKSFAVFVFIFFSASAVLAQTPNTQEPKPAESQDPNQDPPEPPGGTHVFGVLPNFRTVNASDVTGPLTTHRKFVIASKDSFDYPLVLLAGALAGIGQ